jgi:hypothetical protein
MLTEMARVTLVLNEGLNKLQMDYHSSPSSIPIRTEPVNEALRVEQDLHVFGVA